MYKCIMFRTGFKILNTQIMGSTAGSVPSKFSKEDIQSYRTWGSVFFHPRLLGVPFTILTRYERILDVYGKEDVDWKHLKCKQADEFVFCWVPFVSWHMMWTHLQVGEFKSPKRRSQRVDKTRKDIDCNWFTKRYCLETSSILHQLIW